MKRQPITAPVDERIISTKELTARLPLRRESIWRMVRENRFPRPIHLTRSRIGWRWSAIVRWLAEREDAPLEQREYFGEHNAKRKKSA